MKLKLYFLLALIPSMLFSQSEENQIKDSNLICVNIDEFSDKKTYLANSAIWYTDGGDLETQGMAVLPFIEKNKKGKILFSTLYVKVVGIKGCIETGSTLDFIFENGEKTTLVNWNDFNCEGKNYFNINKKSYELFKNNNIKAVKYTNKSNYNSIIVKDNMSEDVNSVIKDLLTDIDKINKGELKIGECKKED